MARKLWFAFLVVLFVALACFTMLELVVLLTYRHSFTEVGFFVGLSGNTFNLGYFLWKRTNRKADQPKSIAATN